MSYIPPNHRKALFITIALLSVIQLAVNSTLLLKGTEYIASIITHDDTYYYLETAWNHKLLGFPTFDKINNTNGFHFLWYLIIYSVAHLVNSKESLVPITLFICMFLNSMSYVFIANIGLKLNKPIFSLILASCWFLFTIPPIGNVNGMENSMHSLMFWWIVSELLIFTILLNRQHPLNLCRLSLALVLNAWSRLDSSIISATIYASCLFFLIAKSGGLKNLIRIHKKSLATSLMIILAGASIQLSLYYIWGKSIIPISGIIKMSNIFPDPNYSFMLKLLSILNLSVNLPIHLPSVHYNLVIYIAVIATIIYRLRSQSNTHEEKSFYLTELILLVSSIIYILYLAISPSRQFDYWYFSPIKIFCISTLSLGFLFISEISTHRIRTPIVILLLLVSIIIGTKRFLWVANKKPNPKGLYYVRFQTALWIKSQYPASTTFAAWNAGQLGFYSNRKFVNLDGLVNNKDYFDRILMGKEPLSVYLKEKNVQYIVDYFDYSRDNFTASIPVVKSFPLEGVRGNGPMRVWSFHSAINEIDGGFYPKKK